MWTLSTLRVTQGQSSALWTGQSVTLVWHTHTHTQARRDAHTRTRAHTHTHTHACTYTHTYTHARTHTHTRMHVHTHTHIYIYTHTHTYAQTRTYRERESYFTLKEWPWPTTHKLTSPSALRGAWSYYCRALGQKVFVSLSLVSPSSLSLSRLVGLCLCQFVAVPVCHLSASRCYLYRFFSSLISIFRSGKH